jgi:hypothetical protein
VHNPVKTFHAIREKEWQEVKKRELYEEGAPHAGMLNAATRKLPLTTVKMYRGRRMSPAAFANEHKKGKALGSSARKSPPSPHGKERLYQTEEMSRCWPLKGPSRPSRSQKSPASISFPLNPSPAAPQPAANPHAKAEGEELNMPKIVSPNRVAANRANAQRSTGPRTPEGKSRSSRNARKHIFTPENYAVVRLEEIPAVANLRADLVACFRPVNSQELFAVERIALAQQSLLRCAALENGLFTACLNETMNPEGFPRELLSEILTHSLEVTRAQNRNYCLAEGFTRLTRTSPTWGIFLRYQAQSERLYRRAVEDFDRLKALRPELPNQPQNEPTNEPIASPQPQETKAPPTPETKTPEPPSAPRPAV